MIKWSKLVFFLSVGLALTHPAAAQDEPSPQQGTPPLNFEAGVVMGIIGYPYASGAVVTGPWSFRVSGFAGRENCSALQLNAGRIVRDDGNATHTLGIMWARFHNGCLYPHSHHLRRRGQYAGVAYNFQVRGFFFEVGPGLGARNPFLDDGGPFGAEGGPLSHVYGQIGYVYRIGRYK